LFEDQDTEGQALPEPKRVKREILYHRNQTHDAAAQFSVKPGGRYMRNWQEQLIKWFLKTQNYISDFADDKNRYNELQDIRTWIQNTQHSPTVELLQKSTEKLEQLTRDLGITNIGIKTDDTEYGYEFADGLPFDVSTYDSGYQRLVQNFKNMRELMRDDVDFFGLFTGPNRTGKTTLNMRMARILKSGAERDCLERTNFVFDPDELHSHSQELGKYGVMIGDEGSRLFYSGDATTSKQKQAKKLLKTYATRNQALLVSDTQFFRLDKEVLVDKCKFEVRIPSRGRFEFYNKEKLKQYEKDPDTGEARRPDPVFEGSFDALSGDDWELYKDLEEEKIADDVGDGD
ncbi:MAG: hypothetical protein ABEI52_09510, partial [Halobacteriaceae archaeon]